MCIHAPRIRIKQLQIEGSSSHGDRARILQSQVAPWDLGSGTAGSVGAHISAFLVGEMDGAIVFAGWSRQYRVLS